MTTDVLKTVHGRPSIIVLILHRVFRTDVNSLMSQKIVATDRTFKGSKQPIKDNNFIYTLSVQNYIAVKTKINYIIINYI